MAKEKTKAHAISGKGGVCHLRLLRLEVQHQLPPKKEAGKDTHRRRGNRIPPAGPQADAEGFFLV